MISRVVFAVLLSSIVSHAATANTIARSNPCEDILMSEVRAERERAVQIGLIDRLDVYLAEPLASFEPDCNPFQLRPVFTFVKEFLEEPHRPASQLQR